jgi:hypothetical protein
MPIPTDRSQATKRLLSHAEWYVPHASSLGFLVHNQQVFDWMQRADSERGCVERLHREATERRVFSLQIQHRMVVTSTAAEIENMHVNRWVTDSIHLLDLLQPAQQADVLKILVRFYGTAQERQAALRVIGDPAIYRDSWDPSIGIAHLFQWRPDGLGECVRRDPTWHNHQRLESHGLALKAFCRWLSRDGEHLAATDIDSCCEVIAMLATYLVAIDYPTAPSAGPWEETPLRGGLSWDTEAIRSGLSALRELLAGPATQVRMGIEIAGRRLAAELGSTRWCDVLWNLDSLDLWLDEGARMVRRRVEVREEAPGLRTSDAAGAFLAQSDLEWEVSGDPMENRLAVSTSYILLLDQLYDDLVRPSGMIRYQPFSLQAGQSRTLCDSYLSANYWLNLDSEGNWAPQIEAAKAGFGASDASDPKVLEARNAMAVEEREAEWFLVTELSRGYTRQARRLSQGVPFHAMCAAQRNLFERCRGRALECLLRGYGRITPDVPDQDRRGVKSNGYPCPTWGLPEAYEWVRWRDGAGRLKERVLPGANTSLAWAAVSLHNATMEWLHLPGAGEN